MRDLRNLDRSTAARVVTAIERLAGGGTANVRRLRGSGDECRLRVGAWRVRFLYQFDRQVIQILRVLPRGRAYR